MATKAKKTTSTDLAMWDEEMARDAKMAAGTEASALGGGFYSIAGTVLSFGGNPLPDNQMAVIIADSILMNSYYEGEYDPQNKVPPVCFALSTERGPGAEKSMKPHIDSSDPQHPTCEGCPMNKMASSATGRGKACKNQRRLAVIPAGDLGRGGRKEDLEMYEPDLIASSAFGWLSVPPTSLTAYASFVDMLEKNFQRAPYAFVTRVKCGPHPKHKMAAVFFEPLVDLRKEAPEYIPVVMAQHKKAMDEISFTFPPADEATSKPVARARAGRAAGAEPGAKFRRQR